MAMIDAGYDTGRASAIRNAVGDMRIHYDVSPKPSVIPSKFDGAIEAGLLFPGYVEGNIIIEIKGKQIFAEAGKPLRLGRNGVREVDRCSYEPLTPLKHQGQFKE